MKQLSPIAQTLIAFHCELQKYPAIAKHLRNVSARRDHQRQWYIRVHLTEQNVQIPREHNGIRVEKVVTKAR